MARPHQAKHCPCPCRVPPPSCSTPPHFTKCRQPLPCLPPNPTPRPHPSLNIALYPCLAPLPQTPAPSNFTHCPLSRPCTPTLMPHPIQLHTLPSTLALHPPTPRPTPFNFTRCPLPLRCTPQPHPSPRIQVNTLPSTLALHHQPPHPQPHIKLHTVCVYIHSRWAGHQDASPSSQARGQQGNRPPTRTGHPP